MSPEKEIILLTLLPLWRTHKMGFFCSLGKRKGVVLQKKKKKSEAEYERVQVQSKMMVWALKKFIEFSMKEK